MLPRVINVCFLNADGPSLNTLSGIDLTVTVMISVNCVNKCTKWGWLQFKPVGETKTGDSFCSAGKTQQYCLGCCMGKGPWVILIVAS